MLATELWYHIVSHLPLTQPSPPLNVIFLSTTAMPLLNSSREGTQPLAWAACSNGGQPFQWKNTSSYPTWTSPSANWGCCLSSCHLLPGKWGWHPPHYNLLWGLLGVTGSLFELCLRKRLILVADSTYFITQVSSSKYLDLPRCCQWSTDVIFWCAFFQW